MYTLNVTLQTDQISDTEMECELFETVISQSMFYGRLCSETFIEGCDLGALVLNLQRKWSGIIEEYQRRGANDTGVSASDSDNKLDTIEETTQEQRESKSDNMSQWQ